MKIKIYNSFKDKFNNEYNFTNYSDFARFWFNETRRTLVDRFPDFTKLQNCASNSKEARQSYKQTNLTN